MLVLSKTYKKKKNYIRVGKLTWRKKYKNMRVDWTKWKQRKKRLLDQKLIKNRCELN
jgi:hypothetical protein